MKSKDKMNERVHRHMKTVRMLVTNACAPDPRVERHARWLTQTGWKVVVHAFDRAMNEEEHSVDGDLEIRRHRVGRVPFGRPLKSLIGVRKFLKSVRDEVTNGPCDVIYCHDADTLPFGRRMSKRLNCPLVFDMHDLHHTWLLMNAKTSLWRRWVSRSMKTQMVANAKHADVVITSSGQLHENGHTGFVEWLNRHGIEASEVQNRSDSTPIRADSQRRHERERWVIGYFGRVRELEPFVLLVEAMLSIPDDQRPSLHVAGDGVAWGDVKALLNKHEDQIQFVMEGAFVAHDRERLFGLADVMYAVYDPNRGNILDGALPVKVFDAADHGVPSVVNEGCLVADLVDLEQLGESVPWNSPVQLAQVLLRLREMNIQPVSLSRREMNRFLTALSPLKELVK